MPECAVGDLVVLCVPENARLHGARAVVDEPTEWGAHVRTGAAATGMFRALHEEMVPLDTKDAARRSVEQGYSGDVCASCQGVRMRRNGACQVCDDCGTQGGCG